MNLLDKLKKLDEDTKEPKEKVGPKEEPIPEGQLSGEALKERLIEIKEGKKAFVPVEHTEGITLLIDAMYLKRNGITEGGHLGDIIAPYAEEVAIENNVPHWGLIDYARGGPSLVAKLEAAIKSGKISGCIFLDSFSLEGKTCKEVLKRYAKEVIKGL